MYGLPQAGIIAQRLLEEHLLKAGYPQSKVTPGYWKHNWQPISFTLVMDDFGIKYTTKLTTTTSSKHFSKTTKLKKTGKELGISASHSIETTRNVSPSLHARLRLPSTCPIWTSYPQNTSTSTAQTYCSHLQSHNSIRQKQQCHKTTF